MRTAVDGADVVGKGVQDFGVGVVVHESNVDFAVGLDGLEGDDLVMQRLEAADFIDELDELGDAAFVAVDLLMDVRQVREHFGLGFAELPVLFFVGNLGGDLFRLLEVFFGDFTQVSQRDLETCVQEGLFSEAFLQGLELVDRRLLEDVGTGLEADGGAGLVGIADDLEVLFGHTQVEFLVVDLAVLTDFDFEPVGQRVDDGGTDAVQTAGDFVAATAEFTAGVEDGQNDRDRGNAQFLIDTDGDASTVVADFDDVPGQNIHFDVRAEAGQRFVDGVVDDLIDQVVQAAGTGRTDVHTGTFPDGLETLQNLDLVGAILIFDQSIHLFDVIELTDGGFLRLDRDVCSFFRRALRLFDGSRTVRRSLRCRLLGLLRSHAGIRIFADLSVFSRQFACGVLQNFCVHFFLIQSKTSRIESCVDDLCGKCSAVQASQQCVGTQL